MDYGMITSVKRFFIYYLLFTYQPQSLPFICAKPAEHSFCLVPEIERKYCVDSHVQITEQECLAIDCCFDITNNACYQADSTWECLQEDGHCVDSSVQQCNRGIITNEDQADLCPDVRIFSFTFELKITSA